VSYLSSARASSPRSSTPRTRFEPMKPAPPVTRTFAIRRPPYNGGLATRPIEKSSEPLPEDVRARRPYILSGGLLKAAARRLLSIASLLFLDLCGLALG